MMYSKLRFSKVIKFISRPGFMELQLHGNLKADYH